MTAVITETTNSPVGLNQMQRLQWDQAATGWNEQTPIIREWLNGVTRAMIDLAAIGPNSRVLDVAAGAGDQSLDIAHVVGPNGFVLASDLSPGILEFARSNAERAGLQNIDFMVMDGEDLSSAGGGFDAVVCRLGLMFYSDPQKGLQEMRKALRPGGRACTIVFSEPRMNPCITILMSTALAHAGLPARDPFQPGGLLSLGQPGTLENLYRGAGFSNTYAIRVSCPFRLNTSAEYLEFIKTSAGPVLQVLSALDDDKKNAAYAEMKVRLDQFVTGSKWEGPNELILGVGVV